METGELEQFNSWWRTGKVREELLPKYRRRLFAEIQRYLGVRMAILIYGLRRVGKTTLMYQLIDEILKDTEPKKVLFFSFDDARFELEDVIDTYQRMILHDAFENIKGKIYVFFDEIQKVDDWENKIKTIYDLHPNIKFILSGSASIKIRKRAKESLAGRMFDFVLDPLSFPEFLEMRGKDVNKIKQNPVLWEREIPPLFNQYIKYGSFPELVNIEDEEIAKRYIKNDVIEKIIYKDLPESFRINDLELLKNLVYIIVKNPGGLIDYASIAKDLKRDPRTISNYFEYLEFGMIIKFASNFRGSPLASRRKLKKAYLQTPNIAFAYSTDIDSVMPKMLENIVMISSDARYFYRNSFEVDFVLEEGKKLIGVEVKTSSASVKQLVKFKEKFGDRVKGALLLSSARAENIRGIKTMPVWEYCLLRG